MQILVCEREFIFEQSLRPTINVEANFYHTSRLLFPKKIIPLKKKEKDRKFCIKPVQK